MLQGRVKQIDYSGSKNKKVIFKFWIMCLKNETMNMEINNTYKLYSIIVWVTLRTSLKSQQKNFRTSSEERDRSPFSGVYSLVGTSATTKTKKTGKETKYVTKWVLLLLNKSIYLPIYIFRKKYKASPLDGWSSKDFLRRPIFTWDLKDKNTTRKA